MAKVSADKTYTTHIGGIITEAGALNFPDGASSDEINMDVNNQKTRVRRLGMDYEASAVLTSFGLAGTFVSGAAVSTFAWKVIGGNAAINFQVVQVGDRLYFYDLASQPLSLGLKGFQVNLNSFAHGAASAVRTERVSMDAGTGFLFVASSKIKPFFVTFDEDADSINSTEIVLQVRDFEGIDDGTEPDFEPPTTLTDQHRYNLRNQGWISPGNSIADPITAYFTSTSEYPPRSKQWHTAKNTTDDFDPAALAKQFAGNTNAPRGHFLLTVLSEDRSTVSGVGSFPIVKKDVGPSSVAFFAGRVWYTLGDSVYYSQYIERDAQIGRCYQEQDPTAETLNEVVETDGGRIFIPKMGQGKAMFVSGNSIIVFASNGIWGISGSLGTGFSSKDFAVDKISDTGIASPDTLVDIKGTPVWWAKTGIYTIGRSETTDRLVANSLSDETIKKYYDDIPEVSREFAAGGYDTLTKKVQWLWKSVATTDDRHMYDMILVLDTATGGFYPQKVETLTNESPWVSAVFASEAAAEAVTFNNVVTSTGDNVVTASGDNVVSRVTGVSAATSQIRYLAFEPDIGTSSVEWTFSALNNVSFLDWQAKDSIGKDPMAFLITGPITESELNGKKLINQVQVFSPNAAGAKMSIQAQWDWTTSGNSGRWTKPRECYRNIKTTQEIHVSKHKAPGRGKSIKWRFESRVGAPMLLSGWSVAYEIITAP